jgi:hypothetical protein
MGVYEMYKLSMTENSSHTTAYIVALFWLTLFSFLVITYRSTLRDAFAVIYSRMASALPPVDTLFIILIVPFSIIVIGFLLAVLFDWVRTVVLTDS